MMNGVEESAVNRLPNCLVELLATEDFRQTYDANRRRVYALAFWITGNELQAEALMERVFVGVFAVSAAPAEETLDRVLAAEARRLSNSWRVSLEQPLASQVLEARRNVKRVDLECAVLQLPMLERLIYLMYDGEGYSHERIARTLGISEVESRGGLHAGRLELRRWLAAC